MLGFSYKWYHEDETKSFFLYPNCSHRAFVNHNDEAIIRKLWEILDEADIVITYNGVNFDVKHFNTWCLKYNLTPPSPYKHVDLLKTARGRFKFESNKLDEVNKDLGYDGKSPMEFDDWVGCYKNDKESFIKMAKYCNRDVEALEQVYIRFMPWIHNHPNMSVIIGEECCPKCGSPEIRPGGWTIPYANGKQYQRVICKTCGAHAVNKNNFRGGRDTKPLVQG